MFTRRDDWRARGFHHGDLARPFFELADGGVLPVVADLRNFPSLPTMCRAKHLRARSADHEKVNIFNLPYRVK